MTALLGSYRRTGKWKIAARTNAIVFLGNCSIDYREAYVDVENDSIRLSVLCILGRATFIVPEGSDVQPSVVSLLASTVFDVPEVEVVPPLPTMVIESTTVLGRCRILTVPQDEAAETCDLTPRRAPTRVEEIGSSRSAAPQP